MANARFEETVYRIVQYDSRYCFDAYQYVAEALEFTVAAMNKPKSGIGRHVSGAELAEGIRIYTLKKFGPMSNTVLRRWGVHTTRDFGEIVFNMVKERLLNKQNEDRVTDFDDVYDFYDAFVCPYLPDNSMDRISMTEEAE
ncbi:MAG: hypothetical protein EOL87_14645 [Spartobacteria bacterium]|nr:hypothetical protein [Spartobacteria bacterium]